MYNLDMYNLNRFMLSDTTPARILTLVLTGLLSSWAVAQTGPSQADVTQATDTVGESLQAKTADEIIFNGSSGAPWRLYLGSSSNWMVPINGPVTTSYKSKVVTVSWIDNIAELDAIQAEWKGGLGQVYWQKESPQDYRDLSEQGGALSMVIRIDKKPRKSVDLKMDCGYPCAGSLNMTQLFKSVPENQWFRISLKLSCFEKAGANLSNILAPLVVATSDDFRMSISDVRLTTNAPAESMVACG
jgi:beta-glucosidase